MQIFHYHFLKSYQELDKISYQIKETFDTTAEKVFTLTESIETDIVIRHSPQNSIPELGISGQYTKDARCIDINLDLKNPYLKNNFEKELARTLIHEYMHVAREQYIEWENGTLLDSLIAEGLAQNFEIEVQPDLSPSIYATAFTKSELDELWTKAKHSIYQRGWENDEWFFGSDTIKRWSGYSLGYKLVQEKINKSGLKASQLYKLPSEYFIKNK